MEILIQNEVSEQEFQNLKENVKIERKFKDACDGCNTFGYCRGFYGKVLCESCIEQEYQKFNSKRSYMNGIERIKILASEIKDKALLKIVDYLLTRMDMNDKYLNEEKSLKQMIEYIKKIAQKESKNGVAIIEDEVVYSMAIHYWDEPNEKLKLEKSKENINENKSERTKPKNTQKKEWVSEGQLTLFD